MKRSQAIPRPHAVPAGTLPFDKREIPTKQDYIWFLDATLDATDPLYEDFKACALKGHHKHTRFGNWLYSRRTAEFQARYKVMIASGPDFWRKVREMVAAQ